MYDVVKVEVKEAVNIAGAAQGSPAKKDKMRVVARILRVMATLIPAAKQSVASCSCKFGINLTKTFPNEAPATKIGKMKPPQKPAASHSEIVTILATPTISAFHKVSISK